MQTREYLLLAVYRALANMAPVVTFEKQWIYSMRRNYLLFLLSAFFQNLLVTVPMFLIEDVLMIDVTM